MEAAKTLLLACHSPQAPSRFVAQAEHDALKVIYLGLIQPKPLVPTAIQGTSRFWFGKIYSVLASDTASQSRCRKWQ